MDVVLVSCCVRKLDVPAPAKELYISELFKKSLKYANKIADKIFILSAKYGLVEIEERLEPYDVTLNKMDKEEKKEWSMKVLGRLKEKTDLSNDNFIFLTGKNYRENIIPSLNHYEVPMLGLGIGRQLKWLKMRI